MGIKQNSWLGLGYHKLCLVGWYWSRWTLISAVLLLFRQRWRMAINRSAEAMTIFSVIQAGLFPLSHGSSMVSVLVLPIPNQFGSLWVNFNSPLLWDITFIVHWWTGC
jgi:molybdopterin-containing oxidoreductase family membrane subunit